MISLHALLEDTARTKGRNRPAREITCFFGEPGNVMYRVKGYTIGLLVNAADLTRAQVSFFSFITPGFRGFSLAVEIQTHKLYLEKSDNLRMVEFALLEFFFFFLFGVSLHRFKLSGK